MEENCLGEFLGEIMKIRMLVIYVVGLSLIGSTWADGLPKMGYGSGRSVKDLVATRLLQRGGLAAQKTAHAGTASILEAGGFATPKAWRLFQHLHRDLVALKSSPRGSADMLAATIFIDYVSRDEELDIRGDRTKLEFKYA
jgi:hypothetical protein